MAVADPYKVLQVLPTATRWVLSAAYRALAQKYHPDHDPSKLAARRMAELNAPPGRSCAIRTCAPTGTGANDG